MSSIKIPRSIDAATKRLVGIDSLLMATEWERAAIVAAFVRLNARPGPKDGSELTHLTPKAFAQLGVTGLRSHNTVTRYVQAWLDQQGSYPEPGRTVSLPTVVFPSESAGTGEPTGGRPRATMDEIVERVRTDESYAIKLTAAIAHAKPETVRAQARAMDDHMRDRLPTPRPTPTIDITPEREFDFAATRLLADIPVLGAAVSMMGGLDGLRPDRAATLAAIRNAIDEHIDSLFPLVPSEV